MSVSFVTIAGVLGGVGLFLLGMRLMTEGLKRTAGEALTSVLRRWTGTPLAAVASGALVTGVVQSSSAVTVATIGFVNAGLLNLYQAVPVVYGANVGTTLTAWLVALLGFQVNIRAFALPAIGLGMMLRLVAAERRAGSMGEALAGFGAFFLGVDVLKGAMGGFGTGLSLEQLPAEGAAGVILVVGIGFLLTLVMQSSSAALALILTAAASGAVSAGIGAALVVGANVGTTSTAAIAVIGATPNAKRLAVAHMVFNLLTGIVALLLLPLVLRALVAARQALNLDAEVASLLALFHTTFNLMGVALMWPLTGRLIAFLEDRFRTVEEVEARPRYLDPNAALVPVAATHALALELTRVGDIARRMGLRAVHAETVPSARMERDRETLGLLVDSVGNFVNRVHRQKLPPHLDGLLPNALRVARYYLEAADLAQSIMRARAEGRSIEKGPFADEIQSFNGQVGEFLEAADPSLEGYSPPACAQQLGALQNEYERRKSALLRAGADGVLTVKQVADQLDLSSDARRMAEQAEAGARYLWGLVSPGSLVRSQESA